MKPARTASAGAVRDVEGVAALASPAYLQEFQGGLADKLGRASDSAWRYADGGFALPARPGLGVEIDEAGIEKFIVKP